MKHILFIKLVGGGTDTYQLVTTDDQSEADCINFVSAVKDGEVFLARVARTVYRNGTYEFIVADKEAPIGYNPRHIIAVMLETPEEHVNRILEGLF